MDDPVVFVRLYAAVKLLHEIAPRLPKIHRPTLVRRLLDTSLDLLQTLTALRYTRRRVALFDQADMEMDRLWLLCRLANDLRVLSTRQYERISSITDDVGRMLGGWRKAS